MQELDLFDRIALTASLMPRQQFTKPDDDWSPMAFFEGAKGEGIIPLDQSNLMADDKGKDVLTEILLPNVIEEMRITRIVFILSVWMSPESNRELAESGEYIPPSQRADRREAVFMTEMRHGGVSRQSMAYIVRYADRPPELGEWEELGGGGTPIGYTGRFVDPIVAALRRVHEKSIEI